jgi:TolB-like protein/Tfp pilus assembly protein PilF
MSPERWQQIEEIFQDALDLTWSEREQFVAEKCVDDPQLKAEVEKLLAQFEDASSFIETPAFSDEKASVLSSLMDFDETDDPMLGKVLGNYKIEREIGRGGMGAVYEAIRADGEFRRKAAIKIVKRGMDTDFILRRFRNERQILATLEHPYITRLLDGGTTDDGRPYFVMDYIEGLPLYRYCDKNRLTIEQRLKLFSKVCEAVEYAHQNLVIHRDLKPSNILVSTDGTPRLLDFGIAKLLNPELASDTLQPTATAMRMMTIDYASPEQIQGEKVTFSTDIYSLGVILFELLTGHRPYRFPNRTPHEVARVICEEPPSLPSYAFVRSENSLPVVHVDQEAVTIGHLAELRNESPDSLQAELKGNLDNITIKALNKLPKQRYESIKKFREDIEKHLNSQPISAPSYVQPIKTQTFQTADNTKLIAVLPLKLFNFSATENTDENYLSLGLADAIISRLTNVRDFTVRPTSSILGYEKSEVDSFQAGRELGVDFVLEGRIIKAGKKLRISLQMLDVKQGAAIWAGQFDENSADILALEDAISEKVAEALVTQVTGDHEVKLSKRGTNNAQAYEAYLKGRFYWNQFTTESLPKAIEFFQKAVELDPNYALAHVGVADFYNWANIYGLIPSLEADKLTENAVKKALEIDDQLGEAYATLSLLEKNRFNWKEAVSLQEKAIKLNPHYQHAHEWFAAILVGDGRTAEGLKEIARAEELDPLSLRTKTLIAWTTYQAQDFSAALAKANEIISLDPNYPQGHLQKGYILIEIGDADEAVAEIEKGMNLMPDSALAKYYYCFALAAANRQNYARQVFDEMKNSDAYVKPMFLGLASVAVGEIDEAFKYLNIAADEFDPWLVWLGTEAKLKPIHSDKRFLELLKRTKNQIIKQFEAKSNEAKSIAVLPFQFIGEAPTGDDYLSIGLADAMITKLSQIRRIIVRPTTSILKFAEFEDAFAVGKELNVDHILCGTIRQAGERIRISAQLLDVKTNATIWAESFDEKFNEILDLEDVVAEKVATLLIPKLSGEEKQNLAKRSVRNVEAYEAYLRGRYHLYSFTPDNFETAISYFEKAIEIDSNYALAYVALSDVHFTLTGFAAQSPSKSFPLIEKFARKAVELDDKLGDAYANLGLVEWYKLERDEGEKLLKRGLELNPNQLNGYVWYSVFLTMQGQKDEALDYARKAYELDPISGFHQYHHIWVLYHCCQFEKAVELTEKALKSVPNFAHGQAVAGWVFRHLNRLEEAVQHSEKAYELSPKTPWIAANLAATYAKNGEKEKALELLQKVESNKTQYVSPYCLAQVYLNLGDKEKTLELLEKSVAEKDVWFPWIATDAQLDSLRHEPRFVELEKKLRGKEKPSATSDTAIHQSQIPTKILTAEELKSTQRTGKKEETPEKPTFAQRHKYKFATTAVLLILISIAYATGILTVDFQNRRAGIKTTNPAKKRSVAILPFKNETGNPEKDFLCDGLSENLINRLTYLSEIQVIPRSTSFKYRGNETTPQQAGTEMNVETILLGKLIKHGNEIEMTTELIEVKSGSRIWILGYRGGESDLVFLQNKMADEVAEKFNVANPKQTVGKGFTQNPQAFEFYLKGEFHRQKATPEDTRKALEFYQKALELDSNYALAFQGLALTYRLAPAYGTISPQEAYPKAKEAAMKALAVDPTLGSAYIPLASIKFVWDWDFAGAETEYKQAIQLAPNNAEAHYSYGNFLVAMGRNEEALNELRIAQQFEPSSMTIASNIGWTLYIAGRFDEAEIQIKQLIAREPNFARGYTVLGEIYQEQGKFDESIAAFQKSKQLSNDTLSEMALGHVYAAAGRKPEAQKIAADLEARVMKKEVSPFLPAVVYAGLNDNDKAFYWLERAFQERSNWLTLVKVGRRLKPLHDDPRFNDLLKRIGFDK